MDDVDTAATDPGALTAPIAGLKGSIAAALAARPGWDLSWVAAIPLAPALVGYCYDRLGGGGAGAGSATGLLLAPLLSLGLLCVVGLFDVNTAGADAIVSAIGALGAFAGLWVLAAGVPIANPEPSLALATSLGIAGPTVSLAWALRLPSGSPRRRLGRLALGASMVALALAVGGWLAALAGNMNPAVHAVPAWFVGWTAYGFAATICVALAGGRSRGRGQPARSTGGWGCGPVASAGGKGIPITEIDDRGLRRASKTVGR